MVTLLRKIKPSEHHPASRAQHAGNAHPRLHKIVVNGILHEETDAADQNQDSDPDQPCCGDGILGGNIFVPVFLTDADPVPDFPQCIFRPFLKFAFRQLISLILARTGKGFRFLQRRGLLLRSDGTSGFGTGYCLLLLLR